MCVGVPSTLPGFFNPQVEVKVAQTKEALAQQAGKARTAAFTHGYGTNYIYSLLQVYTNVLP